MNGTITNIQRFSLSDGDGIRTTVFFKGCNMKCTWCHNPETICRQRQLMFYKDKCIGCGKCFEVCPSGAHKLTEKGHGLTEIFAFPVQSAVICVFRAHLKCVEKK